MQFDQDTIRELSVYAVQQFVSTGTPLDSSIAERAQLLRLSEEQVRRVVEATNVIAFLKLREQAEDKTFEFEVSSFDGVMSKILTPSTSARCIPMSAGIEKAASAGFEIPLEIPEANLHKYLGDQLQYIRAGLEKAAYDYHYASFALEASVNQLVKQADWQERLSAVTTDDEFSRISSVLCAGSGLEKKACLRDMVFVGKELEAAASVVENIKQASLLSTKKAELEVMEKKAFAALGAIFSKAARGFSPVAKKATKAGSAFTPEGVSAGIGRTAKWTAKGAMSAGKMVANSRMGALGAVGTAATVATYTPKINPHTGASNDAWKTLYS